MTLQVSAAGYTTQSTNVTSAPTRRRTSRLTAAPPAPDHATLSGAISIPAMAPCLGAATVEVTSGPDRGRLASADDNGRYVLTNLRLGALTVQASAPGHLSKSESITLTADSTADFKLSASPYLTTGRAVDAVTQSGVASLEVGGDGVSGTSCDSSGAFLVTADTGSPEPRLLIFTGPDLVERRTNVRVPGADASGLADFRRVRSAGVRRDVPRAAAAPLDVGAPAPHRDPFAAVHRREHDGRGRTGGHHARYRSHVAFERPDVGAAAAHRRPVHRVRLGHEAAVSQGVRVSLLNADVITVSRVAGLRAATGYEGYGRWRFEPDGRIVAGIVMLDRDFDRSANEFKRSLRAHELGHALGYQHVTARTSVMNAQPRMEPNDFDLAAARIAFQRPPGNRSPDVDPSSASINRRGSATWSAPIR